MRAMSGVHAADGLVAEGLFTAIRRVSASLAKKLPSECLERSVLVNAAAFGHYQLYTRLPTET